MSFGVRFLPLALLLPACTPAPPTSTRGSSEDSENGDEERGEGSSSSEDGASSEAGDDSSGGTSSSSTSTTASTSTADATGTSTSTTADVTSTTGTADQTSDPTDDPSTTSDGNTADPTGPDPATVLFTEDFESAQDDTVPEGWDSFVAYNVNMNNTPGSSAFALADSSKPHGGARSLHVVGGQSPAMLTRPLPDGVNTIYVRSYVWTTEALGNNPDTSRNHETLIGVRGTPGTVVDEVRFGEIKGALGTNEVPTDDISPPNAEWNTGAQITAGEWHCVEVAFLGDMAQHEVRAWNDGTEVHVAADTSTWTHGTVSADFLTGKFAEFIIGWHSFSSISNEVWFDDIVVATTRIGCE